MDKNKRICWVTASYFLDVDLPIVPELMKVFEIDWYIVTNTKSKESDERYIKSKSECKFNIVCDNNRFFTISHYLFCKNFIKIISQKQYDWYYFDISDFLFFYRILKRKISINKITIATHNVSIPKGARLAFLAKISINHIISSFNNFQVFSKNQYKILENKKVDADIFYCPLMLKDYGEMTDSTAHEDKTFLFFGNILEYKRVDLLLKAVIILKSKGISNFKVMICGNCRQDEWQKNYAPLVENSIVSCDIRRIPNELVSELFGKSDYFVMPYQDIAQSGAMTVAFNYNLPVLASDLDTFTEFVEDGKDGYFFISGSAEDLADKMEYLINQTKQDYNLVRLNQAKMVKETLSSEAIITKYIKYFKDKINA